MPSLSGPVVRPGTMSTSDQPTLSGRGLVLRPFARTDAPGLVAAYGDPGIQQWHVESMTPGEAKAWIDSRSRNWHAETRVDWAVVVESTMVGRISLNHIDLWQGDAETAYWTAAEHRRRGYASSALEVVTAWAFHELGLHRLELTHSTRNVASCRVAQSAGYRMEGTKRQSGLHPDGFHDMHLHARLVTDPAPPAGPSAS